MAGAGACLGLALAGAYAVAAHTSLFAVRTIAVQGAPERTAAEVEDALAPIRGRSLVGLDGADVVRRVEALPTVVSATVDRAFPSTLRVTVRPERPVAVVRQGERAWLVSARGRVMGSLALGEQERLPRIWLPISLGPVEPGSFLLADEGGAAVAALARLPERFPMRVAAAGGSPEGLTLVLGSGTELRLGDAADLGLKLDVAAAVLRSLRADERAALAYLDVSLPARPVAADNPQVESQA
jgi:cell division protein FtsQ